MDLSVTITSTSKHHAYMEHIYFKDNLISIQWTDQRYNCYSKGMEINCCCMSTFSRQSGLYTSIKSGEKLTVGRWPLYVRLWTSSLLL